MSEIERLKAARLKVAKLMAMDAAFAPVFDRLEQEIEIEQQEAARRNRARRLVQREADLRALC